MTINKSKNGTQLTVALGGSLDTNTAPQLEEELAGALDDVTLLVMDFAELEYISSAGLRVLLATHKKMAQNGKMVVRNVESTIMEVFKLTGFASVLSIE